MVAMLSRPQCVKYGSLLVTWYKNIFPQEIFFFRKKYFSPQEIYFSPQEIYFSRKKYIFLRKKYIFLRKKYIFSARNIFFRKNYFFPQEIFFSARNIFFSARNIFFPQEINFSPQEIYFFRKKYFFPQEIFFSARNIFLRKKYFFRKRCTTCSVAQSVSLARASCWGGVWKMQRWISSITCALWGSLRRRFERWEMTLYSAQSTKNAWQSWHAKCTVALKGHHYISFSLHYINFDLFEKNYYVIMYT